MIDIDLVYLWVDGNDPVWAAKRDSYIGKPVDGSGKNCAGRYKDNNELMYSLRSVEKNAPWIHHIYIVTDGQTPKWLYTGNPRISIVDHKEIMPESILPCYNSVVIEHHLHNIPGLSEHFIYANDDMFITREVTPYYFFTKEGQPVVRFNRRMFKRLSIWIKTRLKGKQLTNYKQTIHNAAMLVEGKYGKYYNSRNHHNMDAYLKSNYQHAREVFKDAIDATTTNRVRADNDIQRNLYSYVLLAEKKARLQYVGDKTSFCLQIHNQKMYERFKKYNPTFLCMNDTEYATDADRSRAQELLESLFPVKSEFEK